MAMFIISVILFVAALVGFVVMLGLWTYADAKVRTDNPAAWTLIVVLVPNLLGLIIYLLVGRTKMAQSERKFKKPLIAFAACLMLTTGLMVGSFANLMAADSANLPTWGGVSIGKFENYWNRQWTMSFKTSGAEFSKTVNMGNDDLAAFRVVGDCVSGKLYLRITQDDAAKTLDLSDSFDGQVDLSEFHAGKIKLTIYNDKAKDASVAISWRK